MAIGTKWPSSGSGNALPVVSKSTLLPIEKVFREASDLASFLIQRKMSRIEDVNLGAGYILAVSFSACHGKRGIITSPHDEQGRLTILQPFLPSRIQSNVSLVIEEKIQLNISLSGLVEEIVLIHPILRIDILRVWRSADMSLAGRLSGEEIRAKSGLMRGAILPKSAADLPKR